MELSVAMNFCACIALGLLYIPEGQAWVSVICILNKTWSSDLTLSRLKGMTSIFMGKPFATFVPSKTYIFVPECPNLELTTPFGRVYESENPSHAEDSMTSKCGLPSEFFLTSAPCPDCALMLLDKYKSIREKPTIYIARPYIGKGKTGKGSKDNNKQCQAMLVQAGFELKPWDWNSFKEYIDNPKCKDVIKEMQNNGHYPERCEGTKKALIDIQNMVKNKPKGYYKTECENIVNG